MTQRLSWIKRLELEYEEEAITLVPRLLNRRGMTWLADKCGVSLSLISRWCTDHGVERKIVYQVTEKVS